MTTAANVAKHFRKRLAHEGIKARCKSYTSCGSDWVRVSLSAADAPPFTNAEQVIIRTIAQACYLTRARGLPIVLDQMTDSREAVFMLSDDTRKWF